MKNLAYALALPLVATLAACDSTPSDNQADAPTGAMTPEESPIAATEPATNDQAPAGPSSAAAPHRFADWAGKWTGVEGVYLVITPTEAERYSLEMQYDLDNKVTVEGRDSEHGIKFDRGGKPYSLRRAQGGETGLKWLADKKDCLVVQDGEGYCRD